MGMGKEQFSVFSAGESRRATSTVLQILQEAAKLLWRSWRPMLSIFLVLLLPHTLLYMGSFLILTPLSTGMLLKSVTISTKDPRSPEYHDLQIAFMKDMREITAVEVAIVLVAFLLSSFFLMAAVHTVAMAVKGEQVNLRELLCRIRRTWKGPVVTKLFVSLIHFTCMVILFMLIGAVVIVSSGSMAILAVGGAIILISAIVLLLYLEMVWCQGLVISVVEEDCSGLAALARASELTRGRRWFGFRVNLLLLLVSVVVSVASYLVSSRLPSCKTVQLVGGLASVLYGLLMNAFMLAVYVVFYYECKESCGEEVAMKGSIVYTKVRTEPTLDGALP